MSPETGKARAGGWEQINSTTQKKITGVLDKWVSWDVLRKQLYYFIIFAHSLFTH